MKLSAGMLRQIITEEVAAVRAAKLAPRVVQAGGLAEGPRRIPLTFSDDEMGTEEYGFLPSTGDPDEDDARYQRHLRRKFPELAAARVRDGYVFLSEAGGAGSGSFEEFEAGHRKRLEDRRWAELSGKFPKTARRVGRAAFDAEWARREEGAAGGGGHLTYADEYRLLLDLLEKAR